MNRVKVLPRIWIPSQDLETGCPKLAIVKFFPRRPQYPQITTINMYLIIEIRPSILIKCHGNYIEVEKLTRNDTQKYLGVQRGHF